MKNISVAKKLMIGFGFLMVCICALGWFSISQQSTVAKQNETIADKNIPELLAISALEGAFADAYLNMRTYRLTRDPKYYDAIQIAFTEVRKNLKFLEDLVLKFPELVILNEFNKNFKGIFENYATSVDTSHETVVELIKITKNLHEHGDKEKVLADNLIKTLKDLLDTTPNRTALESTIYDLEHFFNDIAILQVSALEAQNNNNLKTVAEVHDKILATEEKAKPAFASLPDGEIANLGKEILALVEVYNESLEAYIEKTTSIQNLSAKRSEYFKQITALTDSSVAGIGDNLSNNAHNAVATLEKSETLIFIVITALIVASVIFATYLTRSITGPLNAGMGFAQAVANGNLDEELNFYSKDELGKLADALRVMVASLKENINKAHEQTEQAKQMGAEAQAAMEQAKQAQAEAEHAKRQGMLDAAAQLEGIVDAVFNASQELSTQVAESNHSISITSDRITETASAMEEMNATVLEVARSAGDAAHVSNEARSKADTGAQIVQEMVGRIAEVEQQAEQLKDDMKQLGGQAEAIGAIMNVISDIADQTNLLALNAAIEAARAGEAGRGFAVVADEVRKLAEKTMEATVQVGNAIAGVQASVERNMKNVDASVSSITVTTDLAKEAGQSLGEIVEMVDMSADQVRTIATAAEEQSATSEEINRALTSINTASNETATAMDVASGTVEDLRMQAQNLEQLIRELKEA